MTPSSPDSSSSSLGTLHPLRLTPAQALLPSGKARMTACAGDPLSILQHIAMGIDVFTTQLPFLTAEMGQAIVWPLTFKLDKMEEVLLLLSSLQSKRDSTRPASFVKAGSHQLIFTSPVLTMLAVRS